MSQLFTSGNNQYLPHVLVVGGIVLIIAFTVLVTVLVLR